MDAEHEEKPSSEGQSEPSVFSEVKEERILARRKRVQERIEAARREALGEEPHKVRRNHYDHWLIREHTEHGTRTDVLSATNVCIVCRRRRWR